MAKSKLLIIHVNLDSYVYVKDKIKALDGKHGPFDAIIFVGNSVSKIDVSKELLNSPILYIDRNDALKLASHQLNPGETLLNGFGIYQCSNKLTIGYLSLSQDLIQDQKDDIIKNFESLTTKLDILISKEWSTSLSKTHKKSLGCETIDDIVKLVEPRYHITYANSVYQEQGPFLWKDTERITRTINLPEYMSKEKWAYALNFELNEEDVAPIDPKDLIHNPYLEKTSYKRKAIDVNISNEYDENLANDANQPKFKQQRTVLPTNCHFCFTNPNVEDHMFISVNQHSYLTIAKGPLSVPNNDMNFSGHCLIVPVDHIPKINFNQDPEQLNALKQSIHSYEKSVVEMNYKSYDMSTIVFEISSARGVHFHKNLIPIPKYLISNFEQALKRQEFINNEKFTTNGKLYFDIYKTGDSALKKIEDDSSNDYIKFTIYDTADVISNIFVAKFNSNDRIDLQFGRRVVAYLLKLPKRTKWDSAVCKQSKEKEIEEVKNFQKGYKSFDPILQNKN